MVKIPAFQFYPADWLNDIKLQTCSLEAQGLLINLMCLMHQSEPYGYLMINGSMPPMKAVCKVLRLHHKTYQARLKELILSGVLKEDENGIIYCQRMVKDEYIRQVRREAGKQGGSPLLKQKVKQSPKQKTTPSSSSSVSSSSLLKEKIYKKEKEVFGEFKNIKLTNEEYEKLKNQFGDSGTNQRIESLSSYVASKGKKYASHYATILNWERMADKNRKTGKAGILQPTTYAQAQDAERREKARWVKEQLNGKSEGSETTNLIRINNT